MRDIHLIKQLVHDLNGQVSVAQFAEEELVPAYDENEDINPDTFAIEPEGDSFEVSHFLSDKSEFNFFTDGKQRTIQIATITVFIKNEVRIIPIHYYSIGVVILKRTNKKLSLWKEAIIETGIVIHRKAIIDPEKVKAIESFGLNILDTSHYDTEGTFVNNYYQLKQWALQEVKDHRLKRERELIATWVQEEQGTQFLMFDGSLINLRGEENIRRCVGISRGSRIDIGRYDKIMQLREFERSWTFTFHNEDTKINMGVRDRLSWFLRIRDRKNNSPEFGLLRLELHHSYKNDASALADKFSKSIITERLPTAHPDNNWDKTLYPIAVCSKYLSSIMPSIKSIKASMKI